MNTNKPNKYFKDSSSLDFQDSNLKVNSNINSSVCPLIKHKEGYQEETTNLIERPELSSPLTNSNNRRPRIQVSVEFAVEQWFRILLVNINSRNSKLGGAFLT